MGKEDRLTAGVHFLPRLNSWVSMHKFLHDCAENITVDTIKDGGPLIIESTFRDFEYRFSWQANPEYIARLEEEQEE